MYPRGVEMFEFPCYCQGPRAEFQLYPQPTQHKHPRSYEADFSQWKHLCTIELRLRHANDYDYQVLQALLYTVADPGFIKCLFPGAHSSRSILPLQTLSNRGAMLVEHSKILDSLPSIATHNVLGNASTPTKGKVDSFISSGRRSIPQC